MTRAVSRRSFVKTSSAIAAGVCLSGLNSNLLAAVPGPGAPHAEAIGWRLGSQAYTFNRFTFREALEKISSLGLHYVEAYPGQRLDTKTPNVKMGENLSASDRRVVRRMLADHDIKLVNFGVVRLSKDEDACRKTFDFAKDMGIETIVSEPPLDAFDVIEKLCDEYKINLSIHNHPQPSTYWNYETVLKVCKGRSKRIGACCDTGHWMRSDINPVDAIKALEGRIISFHFKDLHKYGKGAHDVPWGTGKGDVKAMLTEVYRQKVKAVFSIEYEHNWMNSVPEIAQSVAYFDKVAADLSASK